MKIPHLMPVHHIHHLHIRHHGHAHRHAHTIHLHGHSQTGATTTINRTVSHVTAGASVGLIINVVA